MSVGILRASTWNSAAVGLCLLLVFFIGCAQGPNWMPSDSFSFKRKQKPEPGPQVASPTERIRAMQEMAEKVNEMTPEAKANEAVQLARSIQHEEDPIVRQQIIRTIAVFQSPVTTAVLTAASKDTDTDVRITACEAWAKHGGPDATKTLKGMLNSDANLDVRIAAARELGKLGDPSAVDALGAALEDKDPALQHRAIVSLRKLTGRDFGDDATVWRDFLQGGTPKEISVVERVKRVF